MHTQLHILAGLQAQSGLFLASHHHVNTGYNKAWIRDTVYATLAFEQCSPERVQKAYHALFDVFLKHEYKIDFAILDKPEYSWQYIHARYHPDTFDEFHEEWGNKQNDAIGAFLFKVGELEKKGLKIIRAKHDERILQKLVYYLQSIKYWQDADNGMWEEYEEVHASSIGACLAGLEMIKDLVHVPEHLLTQGRKALDMLLPRESASKQTDLALLSLIYPYTIVSEKQAQAILDNVENHLVRDNGVIRYVGDQYYNTGSEAEWHFGLSWLALIYAQRGNTQKAQHYFARAKQTLKEDSAPELYLSNGQPNENTPLAWSQSMFLTAFDYSAG
ncbi:glycoside hydrolase family 15 [archaeon CG10_big_fil_rev_8_21_14_0_10_43_11]|nr:MAG: glycoside hydrolase family 15 [archaeon CG10_big_fil_rev_8_21_14_0_10_43_11]